MPNDGKINLSLPACTPRFLGNSCSCFLSEYSITPSLCPQNIHSTLARRRWRCYLSMSLPYQNILKKSMSFILRPQHQQRNIVLLTIATTSIILLKIMNHLPHMNNTATPPTTFSTLWNDNDAAQSSCTIFWYLHEHPMAIHMPLWNVHYTTHPENSTKMMEIVSSNKLHHL